MIITRPYLKKAGTETLWQITRAENEEPGNRLELEGRSFWWERVLEEVFTPYWKKAHEGGEKKRRSFERGEVKGSSTNSLKKGRRLNPGLRHQDTRKENFWRYNHSKGGRSGTAPAPGGIKMLGTNRRRDLILGSNGK